MTKKEELIAFINTINEDTHMLRTKETIIATKEFGNRSFNAPNEHLIDLINEGFDDNLIGSVGTDVNIINILDWFTIEVKKEI
jgi:hypothetical protein